IWADQFSPGSQTGLFTTLTRVASDGYDVDIAADGTIVIAYARYASAQAVLPVISATVIDPSDFLGVTRTVSSEIFISAPRVVADETANAIVVWEKYDPIQGDSPTLRAAWWDDATRAGWSASVEVDAAPVRAWDLGHDAAGNAAIVYQEADGRDVDSDGRLLTFYTIKRALLNPEQIGVLTPDTLDTLQLAAENLQAVVKDEDERIYGWNVTYSDSTASARWL
ncbi:MAG: hypothetical protein VW362_12270, partial [Candidatus Nanopelagicales bacterium]